MKKKGQNIVKRLVTTLVVVCVKVALSIRAILWGSQGNPQEKRKRRKKTNTIQKVAITWIIIGLTLTSIGLLAKGIPWEINIVSAWPSERTGFGLITLMVEKSGGGSEAFTIPFKVPKEANENLTPEKLAEIIAKAIDNKRFEDKKDAPPKKYFKAKVDKNDKRKVKVELEDSKDTDRLKQVVGISVGFFKVSAETTRIKDDPKGEVLMTRASFELLEQSQSEGVVNLRIGNGPNAGVPTAKRKNVDIVRALVESFNKVYSNTPYKARAIGNKVEVDNVPCPDGITGGTTDQSLDYSIGMEIMPDDKPEKIDPFNFSIGLNGGVLNWALGDFALSKEYFSRVDDTPGYDATTKDLKGSSFVGLDFGIDYKLTNSQSIGLKVGLQYARGGTFQQNWTSAATTSRNQLGLSVFAIPTSVCYQLPAANRFVIKIGAGAIFYSATIKYSSLFSISGKEYSYHGKLKSTSLGVQGYLGGEYFLAKKLALTFDLVYSSANLKNFTGEVVGPNGASTEMRLIMADDGYGKSLSISPLEEPLSHGSRIAGADLSGLQLSLGIKFSFDSKKRNPPAHHILDLQEQPPIDLQAGAEIKKTKYNILKISNNKQYIRKGGKWWRIKDPNKYAKDENGKEIKGEDGKPCVDCYDDNLRPANENEIKEIEQHLAKGVLDNLDEIIKWLNEPGNKFLLEEINKLYGDSDLVEAVNKRIENGESWEEAMWNEKWKVAWVIASSAPGGKGAGKASKIIKKGWKGISKEFLKRAKEIRSAQATIGKAFSNSKEAQKHFKYAGKSLESVIKGLKSGDIKPGELPIRAVRINDNIYTVDNRSLYVLRKAGKQPTVIKDCTHNKKLVKEVENRLAEMEKKGLRDGPDFVPKVRD